MSRAGVPSAFTPAGWAATRAEQIHKEAQLATTSASALNTLRRDHGGRSPPHGWAWFNATGAGFCDTNDTERLGRARCPQQPYWHTQRAAGHDSGDQKTGILMDKHFGTGRTGFLDRTSATYFSETMGSPKSRSAPVSPFGAQSRGHLSRSLSSVALGPASPAAGSETWRINRSTSEISLKPLYNPQKTPQQTSLR
mmetsp:Transcript_26745/g.71203  ORF Transcript_26745/g.71203 Transcript_26745/m.71203 type:complete len:196 (+) Transcript_26745:129-716(+)